MLKATNIAMHCRSSPLDNDICKVWTRHSMIRRTNVKKRCDLQTKGFLEVIYPIISIAKPLGLSPLSIGTNDGRRSVELSPSSTVVYSYAFMAFSHTCQALALMWLCRNGIYASVIMSMMFFGSRILISAVLNYSLLLRRKSIFEVLQKLNGLEINLPAYYTAAPISILLLIFVLSTVEAFVKSPNFEACLLVFLIEIGPSIVCIYTSFMYICQVSVLKSKIQDLISDLLASMIDPLKLDSTLRPIIQWHLLAREICYDLNEAFGLPMLLTSSAGCLGVTISFFVCCVSEESFDIVTAFLWSAFLLMPEIAVMFTCQKVENVLEEAKAISVKLQLTQTPIPRRIKKEAQELNLQLKQLPLKFSAGGLFYLNGQQLNTAVSTIITYMIILLQNIAHERMQWGVDLNLTEN